MIISPHIFYDGAMEFHEGLPGTDHRCLQFFDLESSGLAVSSYPTEFGFCGLDLNPVGALIRPRLEWNKDEWSPVAEAMTGISRILLDRDGIDPDLASEMIEDQMKGKIVLTDNQEFDSQWLGRLKPDWRHVGLYSTTPFERRALEVALRFSPEPEIREAILRIRRFYPHLHRARPDAQRMAAGYRVLMDPGFRAFILRL